MDYGLTALERAFQLAKAGNCHSVPDIKKQLRAEGFSVAQITGKSLYKQLKGLLQGHASQKLEASASSLPEVSARPATAAGVDARTKKAKPLRLAPR